ncbi:MAG TPA: universal stress protein [Chthonomonadaceae bacterium]|nr:universal stress protein [Chthonomonadaceae bacterium]
MSRESESERRPTPEEILARVMRQERQEKQGRLKIFLGFAAGVGKTFEMLNEANRRKQRGQDVVIGYIETHKRRETEAQLGDLEVIPRKVIEYRGAKMEEMDTDAILARHPHTVLVDELAHTNVPGSEREKRWQDVEAILNAGINVLSTMNVQHMESLNDTIHDITGIWVRETVPDRIVRDADEVKMVDITPRALINRLERGDIYSQDKVQQALGNWFREGNLSALREIALREIAHEVDEEVTAYRKERHVTDIWATHDRVMVCISPDHSSMRLLRRAWRVAQRLHGDIVAVYVENKPPSEKDQEILRNDFALADRLKIPVVTLHGDVANEIIRYSRENRITQIVVGHSDRSRWQEFLRGSIINRLTQELRNIDILIVAQPEEKE